MFFVLRPEALQPGFSIRVCQKVNMPFVCFFRSVGNLLKTLFY